ncbi:lipopolysaccharide biosynthesis protein [Treponema brennaborense]|uniref:Polysaccharide biosynthesis protein n=1 Tax=Treponema brennaborense (strain DSM 12168 / CIP 105900 / DD5/3) TaxID=906968 RepID=F4LID2_TREBD|nr:lipopolysaccharide biosynthesis protein [Treponema brennaborense]AEE16173.1 polysaccharide biosynthesis protein [Treponema brennaborense DSM 12168]
MSEKITKNTVISSLIWKFLERGGVQGVQFILSIVLARLVTPSDYGVIALLLVFVQIANVFIQSGFNTALIQKKDSDDVDFSSILYLSLFISAVLYLLLFFISPIIAEFYNQPVLKPLLRVISITLFFGAVNSVQSAYISKTMQFKRFFFSSMGAVIGSGILGIILAYFGFGVWALVFQQLSSVFLTCVILWFTVKWRPKLLFSFERVKQLFGFGWKLLCSALLDTVFRNIYNLVIGRLYSSSQLGVFNRGQQFPQVIASNLDGSIQSVMLPTLSANNDNVQEVKRITRRSISTSAYILMPCMFGLAAVAEPLVKLLLTDKWLPCVPFLQLACISYALYPIHTANLTGINALGRSDIFLKLEIIKKIVTVINLVITIPLGIYAMAVGQVVSGFISTFINAYPNKKLMGYSYIEQWKDLLPSFLLSIAMAAAVWSIHFIPMMTVVLLILQILAGFVIYTLLSKLFHLESYEYFVNTIKGLRK